MSLKDKITTNNPLIDLEGLNQYDGLVKQHITDTVQAKVQAFVCENLSNIVRTTGSTIPDDSQDSYILVKTITTINGKTEGVVEDKDGSVKCTVNIGDTIFLTDPNISDWWVSAIAYDSLTTPPTPVSFTITKLETQKVDLSDYVTTSQLDAFSGRLGGVENFQEEAEATLQYLEPIVNNDLLPLVDKVSSLENKKIATESQIYSMFAKNN